MNAVAHTHIKPPSFANERFVTGAAAELPMAGRLGLAIGLCFHNHVPQECKRGLAFHQQKADELGGELLAGAGEEGLRAVLGERCDYGSEWGDKIGLHKITNLIYTVKMSADQLNSS